MRDLIIGQITKVIDDERVVIHVTQIVRNRYHHFDLEEKVLIRELKYEAFEGVEQPGAKEFAPSKLKGKGVLCLIRDRDLGGCIEADVYLLPRGSQIYGRNV